MIRSHQIGTDSPEGWVKGLVSDRNKSGAAHETRMMAAAAGIKASSIQVQCRNCLPDILLVHVMMGDGIGNLRNRVARGQQEHGVAGPLERIQGVDDRWPQQPSDRDDRGSVGKPRLHGREHVLHGHASEWFQCSQCAQ